MTKQLRTFITVPTLAVFLACTPPTNSPDRVQNTAAALTTKSYDVADIIHAYESPRSTTERIQEWIVCITANIDPRNWNTGNASIAPDPANESIIVQSTPAIHAKVQQLFDDVRKMLDAQSPSVDQRAR